MRRPLNVRTATNPGLDLLNAVTGSYGRFFSLLEPMLHTSASTGSRLRRRSPFEGRYRSPRSRSNVMAAAARTLK